MPTSLSVVFSRVMVNKCRCRCLMHCCSTLKRNRISVNTRHSTWRLQWRWNCGGAQLQASLFHVTANYNTYRNQQKPGWQTGNWIHLPHTIWLWIYRNNALSWEEGRTGKRTSAFTPHHQQTCTFAAMHEITYCRKPGLKKLHCITVSLRETTCDNKHEFILQQLQSEWLLQTAAVLITIHVYQCSSIIHKSLTWVVRIVLKQLSLCVM